MCTLLWLSINDSNLALSSCSSSANESSLSWGVWEHSCTTAKNGVCLVAQIPSDSVTKRSPCGKYLAGILKSGCTSKICGVGTKEGWEVELEATSWLVLIERKTVPARSKIKLMLSLKSGRCSLKQTQQLIQKCYRKVCHDVQKAEHLLFIDSTHVPLTFFCRLVSYRQFII